ncbi:alpha/beta fold hydrolase [Flagellimonas flava]|uniref:Pimeloyl-ACP methyl ester carboxylesterase n=1 Tax=Flagellimonas flava TaxID=570519 RepID=A0A1M5IRL6_9FLAO|nr:alpha/beta fold hydrolase [Allomuricauda flava]SHG30901.1 Pimeloyl-ACP methyl ester carboxylesterase [Allomuricauda flava]
MKLHIRYPVLLGLVVLTIGAVLYGNGISIKPVAQDLFTMNLDSLHSKQMTLSDRKVLSYAIYGDPHGIPVFYFHGGQESRLSSAFMDSTAARLGVRIIAPERPGVGRSSFQEGRTFLDYPKDIEQLADHLNIDTFSIFGLSGGSPHVLACAHKLDHRLNKVAIVSGTAPHDYKGKLKGMWFPIKLIHWFAKSEKDKNLRGFIANDYKTLDQKPHRRLRQLQRFLPKPDRKLLKAEPEYGIEFIKGSREAYRQGIDAVVQEWKLYVRDWGFKLHEIETPISLWYGDRDKMTPKYRGLHLNKALPNSELILLEDEGHFSLIRNHLGDILKGLM